MAPGPADFAPKRSSSLASKLPEPFGTRRASAPPPYGWHGAPLGRGRAFADLADQVGVTPPTLKQRLELRASAGLEGVGWSDAAPSRRRRASSERDRKSRRARGGVMWLACPPARCASRS
jgi:hypothetical protein